MMVFAIVGHILETTSRSSKKMSQSTSPSSRPFVTAGLTPQLTVCVAAYCLRIACSAILQAVSNCENHALSDLNYFDVKIMCFFSNLMSRIRCICHSAVILTYKLFFRHVQIEVRPDQNLNEINTSSPTSDTFVVYPWMRLDSQLSLVSQDSCVTVDQRRESPTILQRH